MTPHRGNTILFHSSQQLPRLRLGPLNSFFLLSRHPSSAFHSPSILLLKLHRKKDIRCAALDADKSIDMGPTMALRLNGRQQTKTYFFKK